MAADTLRLRVHTLRWEAEGVLGIELRSVDGRALPAVEAGAHVDLHLPMATGPAMVRSYSLTDAPGETRRYTLAVNRDAHSRGGSRWIHDQLRPGVVLDVSPPRNHFALHEGAAPALFIAGGIGITPLLSMARQCTAQGRPWALLHAVRSRDRAAFVDELAALAARAGAALRLHVDDEAGAVLNLAAVIAQAPRDAHLYACGPAGLMRSFVALTQDWPAAQVHIEYFAPPEPAADAGPATPGEQPAARPAQGYAVQLARSGRRLEVAPGQGLLDALEAAGLSPLFSCRQGLCGTCEVKVLAGTPDHRDHVLSAAEKARNDRMMVCCSGALSATLELDL